MTIRPAQPADHETLVNLWLRSVRASHHFLTEQDIQALLPLVHDAALPNLELWVLEREQNVLGFLGLAGVKVEALFLAPEHFRQGHGRRLIEFARELKGPMSVDVNEQNPEACHFYEALGFVVESRSPVDDGGRPFPLLHMRQLT